MVPFIVPLPLLKETLGLWLYPLPYLGNRGLLSSPSCQNCVPSTVPVKGKLTVSTRISILDDFENRVSSFENQVSSFERLAKFFEELGERFRGKCKLFAKNSTRSSKFSRFKNRGTSLEDSVSRDCQFNFHRYCMFNSFDHFPRYRRLLFTKQPVQTYLSLLG